MEKLSKEIERILKQEKTNKAKRLKAMQIKQLTDFIKNENINLDEVWGKNNEKNN